MVNSVATFPTTEVPVMWYTTSNILAWEQFNSIIRRILQGRTMSPRKEWATWPSSHCERERKSKASGPETLQTRSAPWSPAWPIHLTSAPRTLTRCQALCATVYRHGLLSFSYSATFGKGLTFPCLNFPFWKQRPPKYLPHRVVVTASWVSTRKVLRTVCGTVWAPHD